MSPKNVDAVSVQLDGGSSRQAACFHWLSYVSYMWSALKRSCLLDLHLDFGNLPLLFWSNFRCVPPSWFTSCLCLVFSFHMLMCTSIEFCLMCQFFQMSLVVFVQLQRKEVNLHFAGFYWHWRTPPSSSKEVKEVRGLQVFPSSFKWQKQAAIFPSVFSWQLSHWKVSYMNSRFGLCVFISPHESLHSKRDNRKQNGLIFFHSKKHREQISFSSSWENRRWWNIISHVFIFLSVPMFSSCIISPPLLTLNK